MTDREAMKLALEALELLTGAWQTFDALDYGDNAIAALKERLADHAMREVQRLGQEIEQEKALQALHNENERLGLYKDAYAQPEQEPDYKLLFGELAEKFALLLDEKKMWKKQALFCFDVTAPPQRTEPLIGCVNHDCAKCKEKNT